MNEFLLKLHEILELNQEVKFIKSDLYDDAILIILKDYREKLIRVSKRAITLEEISLANCDILEPTIKQMQNDIEHAKQS